MVVGQPKNEISSIEEKDLSSYFASLLGAMSIYIAGFMAHGGIYGTFFYPNEYKNLNNKKTELVRKIDELQRFIPLMDKQFTIQYKDSLENAVRDASEINLRISEIKQKHDKIAKKTKFSWLAFFMKD